MGAAETLPLPVGWFAACPSDELEAGEVRPARQLGRDLVLYRGENGRAVALDAYCPHLGAHLGFGGKVVGDTVQCPFHAWRFDATGRCVEVPYARKIPPRAELAPLPLAEWAGLVCVGHSAAGSGPGFELSEPDLPDASLVGRGRWEIDGHPQELLESAVDVRHLAHVQEARAEELGFRCEGTRLELEIELNGADGAEGADGGGRLRVELHGPGLSLLRFSGPTDAICVQSVTPTDPGRVEVRHSYLARSGDPGARAFFAAYRARFERELEWLAHRTFQPQPPLTSGDASVDRFREWYRQFYPEPETA